jgi:competence ComEA-like helix-hairpin-helix protein
MFVISLGIAGAACTKPARRVDSQPQTSLTTHTDPKSLRININTASTSELEKLPGIGKVLAERIVTHRVEYGPFRRREHIMMVRGISDRKFREIRGLITVE